MFPLENLVCHPSIIYYLSIFHLSKSLLWLFFVFYPLYFSSPVSLFYHFITYSLAILYETTYLSSLYSSCASLTSIIIYVSSIFYLSRVYLASICHLSSFPFIYSLPVAIFHLFLIYLVALFFIFHPTKIYPLTILCLTYIIF